MQLIKVIYFLIAFSILLTLNSCKDKDRIEFVLKVINNPDSLEYYLHSSSFKKDIFFNKVKIDKNFIKSTISEVKEIKSPILKDSFELIEDGPKRISSYENNGQEKYKTIYEIKLISKWSSSIRLSFIWELHENEFNFSCIVNRSVPTD